MVAYFIDLDGVFFRSGTMEPLPGAVETVTRLAREGHQVLFVSARETLNANGPELCVEQTRQQLDGLGLQGCPLLGGIGSPRFIVDDSDVAAISCRTNEGLSYDRLGVTHSELGPRTYSAIMTLAWTHLAYGIRTGAGVGDFDDYVQTILLARSLCASRGYDHADFVRRLRQPGALSIGGVPVGPAGLPVGHSTGQIAKLLRDNDPHYLATDGITDGATMRVLGLSAWYGADIDELIDITDEASRVTHAEPEARLAAVLVAIRYRQCFTGSNLIGQFRQDAEYAARRLGFGPRGMFVLRVLDRGLKCVVESEPLHRLGRRVGFLHLSFSAPLSAVAYSFVGGTRDKMLLADLPDPRKMKVGDRVICGLQLDDEIHGEYCEHLSSIGQLEAHDRDYEPHGEAIGSGKGVRIDVDTFLGLTLSLMAARDREFLNADEERLVSACLPHGLHDLAMSLSRASSRHRSPQ